MQGVVVGIDRSEHSQPPLRWAAAYGARRELPVTALMATEIFVLHDAIEPRADVAPPYDEEGALAALQQYVAGTLGGLHGVTCTVVEAEPSQALIDASDDAELIVVGARGIGGFRRLLLGSVSRKVLHKATCPVAVIRDARARGARPVVVGVNGDDCSIRALRWAVDHAAVEDVPVHATFVWNTGRGLDPARPDAGLHHAERAESAERFLQRQLDAAGIADADVQVEPRVIEGRPSAALLEASRSASMLVLGARSQGAAGVLLGSVSDQVAHHAACPVVIVP